MWDGLSSSHISGGHGSTLLFEYGGSLLLKPFIKNPMMRKAFLKKCNTWCPHKPDDEEFLLKSWCVFCISTPLYRRFRLSRVSQTIDLEEIYRLVAIILNFAPYGSVLSRFCVFFRWRAAPSSGPITCDTSGPDYSSSSLACGCKSCKMCTTILVKTPHHRACVGIMCHTFAKKLSSSSDLL